MTLFGTIRKPAVEGPPPKWSLTPLLILLGIIGIIISTGTVYYRYLETQSRLTVEEELTYIAQSKFDQLITWRKEQVKDASTLADNPILQNTILNLIQTPRFGESPDLTDWLETYRERYSYSAISILDKDGSLVFRIPFVEGVSPDKTIHRERPQWKEEALRTRKPVLTDMHRDPITHEIHMETIFPVYTHPRDPTPTAFVVLHNDLSTFFYPLIESWPTRSKTAETLLVRKEGDDVLFLTELRHRPNSALEFRIPLSRNNLPAGLAIGGTTGAVAGLDYRGEKVFSVVRSVPDSNWYMVAKIDQREALSGWLDVSFNILLTLCALVVASGSFFLWIWYRQSKNHYRELFLTAKRQQKIDARHRVVLMSIREAVITTDIRGNIEFLNPVAENLTGWLSAEAKGKPLPEVFNIINESTREPVENPVDLVLKNKGIVGLANHTLLIKRNGEECPIADSGSPVFDDEGNLSGVVLIFRDQTREILSERQLLKESAKLKISEERFRKALELSPFPAMMHAENGKVLVVNQQWRTLTGYESEEISTIGDWTEKAYGERNEEIKTYIEALYQKNEKLNEGTYTIRCKDGSTRIWDFASMPMGLDKEGSRLVLSMAIDVTETQELQYRLVQAEKLESVGKLAGGVAHDFNNLLMGIMNYVDLCLEEVESESLLKEWLNEINQIAERSAGITRQLLAFARKQTISPIPIHLESAVPTMINMLQRLIGEDIELIWKPAPPLWSVFLDSSQLDQIITNLAVNARDAIAGVGKIILSAENITVDAAFCQNHLDASPGEYVRISMKDNGSGMDQETCDHAFEPFYTSKAVGKGTGLGLATVYGIINQNKGFIDLQSALGQGSTFHIYLPRYKEIETEKICIENKGEHLKEGHETILLTEDEAAIRNVLNLYLSQKGYNVLSAESPEEGFRIVKSHAGSIDLLITDLIMPGMNGRQFSEQLKKDFPKIKILFMSGYTADILAQRDLLDEDVHFLAKPFTSKHLVKKVREILDS